MWLYEGLKLLNQMRPITEIIEGGAPGFDQHGANWALWQRGCGNPVKLTTVKAEWGLHGDAAGPIRNDKMARMKPDVVLAAPGGPGTAHMVKTATAHGLKVVMLEKMPVVLYRPAATHPQ